MNGSVPGLVGGNSCDRCKYFVDVGSPDGLGECHRYPPRTDSMLVGLKETGEPIIHRLVTPGITPAHGWCGEFVVRLVIPKKA